MKNVIDNLRANNNYPVKLSYDEYDYSFGKNSYYGCTATFDWKP